MQKTYPKKRLGQNFLMDKNIARKIVRTMDVPKPIFLIEIGPGRGVLTEFILKDVDKYLGIEIDSSLIELLQDRFSEQTNFSLIQQDFLEFDLEKTLKKFSDHSKIILGIYPIISLRQFYSSYMIVPIFWIKRF